MIIAIIIVSVLLGLVVGHEYGLAGREKIYIYRYRIPRESKN